jgi:choline dehydrogenase-like flavoprotein
MAISGTYFIRARKQDFEKWSSGGNHEWAWQKVLPFYNKLENDLQFGLREGHGRDGPMIISRLKQDHQVTTAFAGAVKYFGFTMEPDKNNQDEPGYGPLPTNSLNGRRINPGFAYLSPARDRPNLTVEGNACVRRVVFDGTRAIGVEVLRNGTPSTIEAKEIVLAAGAVKTPHILLLSGVGPRTELESFGIPVVSPLQGVGRDFSDHPNIAIGWKSRIPLVDYATTQAMADVLNFTASGSDCVGDLEIIPLLKPMSYMLEGRPSKGVAVRGDSRSRLNQKFLHPGDLAFLVSLQAGTSRGEIALESADPEVQPRIDFNYLSTENDTNRMREAVRIAVGLLQSPPFEHIFAEFTELTKDTLQHDRHLDAWIRKHLGTAIHLCGSAKFGPPNDPHSVVDQYGRVYGVEGLRVADTSILPTAPTRGTAATAVLIGERIADFIRREHRAREG